MSTSEESRTNKTQATRQEKGEAETVDEIKSGSRGLHQLPRGLAAAEAAALRRRVAESSGASELRHIASYSLDDERASTRNCENFIGAAQVPMGLVGPLHVRGREIDGETFVPLATTEGALLASVNRGCRAIARSGGAAVDVVDVGMTRAPAFRVHDLTAARRLTNWLEENYARIKEHAEATSRFLELVELRPIIIGTTVLIRFRFTTGDAMGMNMATIACDRVVTEIIEPETGAECVALSGNYCVDKKPSAVNFQLGRGKSIRAEAEIPADVLEKTLKTTASSLVEVQVRKNFVGSIAAGAMGYNAQFANVLAGLFLACGQDLAHVVEGSMGITTFEEREAGAVHAAVYLPDCPVAAIGGGTSLATQREALSILGIAVDEERPGTAAIRLAEITGAVVLAGELSLMAAFTSRDLARAHERLGR